MKGDIESTLLEGHSKTLTLKTVNYIGANQARFDELMNLFLKGESRISQRASWALILCLEREPQLGNKHYEKMVHILVNQTKSIGIRRNIIRTFQTCSIPEDIESELYDFGLKRILDTQETVAIRAFSMTVCERIVKRYPDLKNEFLPAVKVSLQDATPGIKSRATKILERWK